MTYRCRECDKETNSIWIDDPRIDVNVGVCSECFFRNLKKKYPAPPINDLKVCIFANDNWRAWPHSYIPSPCPYCGKKLDHIFLGSADERCYEEVVCHHCNIDFGMVD